MVTAFTSIRQFNARNCILDSDERVVIRIHPISGEYLVYDSIEKLQNACPSRKTLYTPKKELRRAYSKGTQINL